MPAGVNENFRDVHEGDQISAKVWNTFGAQLNRLSQFQRGNGPMRINGCGVYPIPELSDELYIYNGGAEATIPAYGIVRPNGVTSDHPPVPSVKRPNVFGCQENFYINGQTPISANSYGTAQQGLNGGNLFIVAYDSSDGTPSQDEYWGPRSGTYLLKKNTGGFKIVGVEDSTNHYVWVRSAPMYRVLAKTTATINAKSSDSNGCTVYTGSPGVEASTGVLITGAYNYANCAINSGKFVFLDWAWWSPVLDAPYYITLADTS